MSKIEQVKDILVAKNKEALVEIIDAVGYPALQEAVAKTSTQLDDYALAALGSELVKQLKQIIEKL